MTARTLAALGVVLALGMAHADAAQPGTPAPAAQSIVPATGDAGLMHASPATPAKPMAAKPVATKTNAAKTVATKTVTTKAVATKAVYVRSVTAKRLPAMIGMATMTGKHSSLTKVAGVRPVARAHRAHLAAAKSLLLPHFTRVHKTASTRLVRLTKKAVAKHA